MIKMLHLSLVMVSIISFIGRIILSETQPQYLRKKWLKIAPHVLDTLLLLSGATLVFQGQWLSGEYGWIVAKLIMLIAYIGFATIAMRRRGTVRWLAFLAAMACFAYIGVVAVTKDPLFFL
ncbi:SirB2 family protein [Methylosoma difficile]